MKISFAVLTGKYLLSHSKPLHSRFRTRIACYSQLMPIRLTDIGEGIREVTVKQWFISENQNLTEFDDICEVESDKATVTITSRYSGVVKKIHYEPGNKAAVGSVLLDIEIEDVAGEKVVETVVIEPSMKNDTLQKTDVKISVGDQNISDSRNSEYASKSKATPAVRRLAKENNVSINSILGTGKGGRVLKEDILTYLSHPKEEPVNPIFNDEHTFAEPISGYRKVMVKTMTESGKIPTLTLSDEINVTKLESLRQQTKSIMAEQNVRITLLPFIVKAVSLSLREYPIMNSIFDKDEERIVYQKWHNICIAIDTTAGLVTPNIKRVQQLSIKQIIIEIERLRSLANERKLSIADVAGGTFSISNIGSIAGTVLKPLILPPQVAIVGIGRIQIVPRYEEDTLQKCHIMNVSWACDHRIIDGATVARFSNLFKRYVENPSLMVIDS